MSELPYTQPARECGDCNMCCQGFLWADIHGYHMSPGIPCHFVSDNPCGSCTIYDDRPEVCSGYECMWKSHPTIPEWMKPNKADVLITNGDMTVNGINYPYVSVKEGFNHIRSDVLNWVLRTCIQHNLNVTYQCHGAWYWQGDDNWMKAHMESRGYSMPLQQPAQDS